MFKKVEYSKLCVRLSMSWVVIALMLTIGIQGSLSSPLAVVFFLSVVLLIGWIVIAVSVLIDGLGSEQAKPGRIKYVLIGQILASFVALFFIISIFMIIGLFILF